jgi:hypothetical protein
MQGHSDVLQKGEADTPEQAAYEGPGAISEKSAAVLPLHY